MKLAQSSELYSVNELECFRPPAVVYLDTQDYSRYADVLAGRGPSELISVFDELIALRDAGHCVFAFSMPVMSELLQYNPEHRELTLRKARAVEELCRGYAFAYPGQVIAEEMASAIHGSSVYSERTKSTLLNDQNRWGPPLRGAMEGVEERVQAEIERAISAVPVKNRQARRIANRVRRRFKVSNISEEMIDAIIAKWPVSSVSLGALCQLSWMEKLRRRKRG